MNPFAIVRRLRARYHALAVDLNDEAQAVELANYDLRTQIIAAEIDKLVEERDRATALVTRFDRMIARKRDELAMAQGRAERARVLAMIDRAEAIIATDSNSQG